MELRDYQSDLINKARASFKHSKRVLCVAPCGAGKTAMFAHMCQQHIQKHTHGCVWFLVHRRELIEQTEKTFEKMNVAKNGIFIGMVQTVSRKVANYSQPTMIVFDEAHHASARTWSKILEAYPDVPLVGLTATPCRLDGKPLGDIFTTMVQSVDAEWLIKRNYLSEYQYFAPKLDLESAEWQIKGSDYDQKQISQVMDERKVYGDVLKYFDPSRKTILYCPDIKFSQKIAKEINEKFGPETAVHFDGDTPKSERQKIVDGFRDGTIRALCNVDLVGEGFDVPDCDTCFLLRPTMSVALFIQQAMRCMRYKEGKTAKIYDFVGNVFRHGMPTEKREWSLNKSVKIRNKTQDNELIVRECAHCLRVYEGTGRFCLYCGFDNGKTRAEIKRDNDAEMLRIEEMERKKERREVGMCHTFSQLVELGRKRGYKNPAFWATKILEGRKKIKNLL